MVTMFPANLLGIKVEILLNATWTDISVYVYQRDIIQISGIGRTDWTQAIQASQMTITINNKDGRFTPNNSSGAYYPYIQLNTQIRLSVDSESATSVVYSGYRFWGEVSEWPVAWDPTGTDVYVQIVVSGIWRRLSQQQQTIGSPFNRYRQTTSPAPKAYWSFEDGSGSLSFAPGIISETAATWTGGPPALSSDNVSFLGSDAMPTFGGAEITATVPSGGSSTDNVIRFVLSVPVGGDSGGSNWNIIEVDSSGTIASYELYLLSNGTLQLAGVNSGGTRVFSTTTTTNVQGIPIEVSMELTSTTYALHIIKPGGTSILETKSGSFSNTLGNITTIKFNRSKSLQNSSFGQLTVYYSSAPSQTAEAYALSGYIGEFAMDRFTRLCGEFGIAAETIGTNTSTQAMGYQTDDHLADVLQMIENTDGGLLYETRDQFGLGYRSMVSMQNQSAGVVMNYATAMVAQPLAPTFDDSLIANSVAASAQDGYTIQAELITGAMSILNPPNGVGNGYSFTKSISVAADSQVSAIAVHYLNLGTVNDFRVPNVTVDLTRSAVVSLFDSVPSMRIGDYLQITNPPGYWSSSTIKQLAWGWTETLNARTWTIEFNTISELPWETTFSPGTVQTMQQTSNPSGSSAAPATISGSAIGTSLISSAQIASLKASLIGNVGVLNANPYFLGGDTSGWSALNGTFGVVGGLIGAPYAWAGQYTNNGVTAGYMQELDSSGFGFPVTPGQQIMVTGWFNSSVTSVKLGFIYHNAGGSPVTGPTNTTETVTAATWTQLTVVQTVPAGAAWAAPVAGSPSADGSTLYVQAVYCLPQVPGTLLAAGTVPSSAMSFAIGGILVTFAATAPTSPTPNAGDLWYDTSNGNRLNQYNGTSWTPYTFGTNAITANSVTAALIAANTITAAQIAAGTITATQIAANTITGAKIAANTITASLIQTGTITATQIATGTITAALLVSNIVVAGIVDATTISALKYVAAGSSGQFLAYTGTPSGSNMAVSISGAAGSDSFSTPYAAGVEVHQGGITLDNQSSSVSADSSASVLYSSGQGRLRYINSGGADLVLDRSAINLGHQTMTTQTSATIMSGVLNYLANEAQTGSEYEIEIDGTITSPSAGGALIYSSEFWSDGATLGANSLLYGAVFLGTSQTIAFTLRWRMSISTTGSSGQVTIVADGGATVTNVTLGNLSNGGGAGTVTLNSVSTALAFDTTSNHALAIYQNWGTGAGRSGHSAITYRTKITRRY